jgi:hypothetical protein
MDSQLCAASDCFFAGNEALPAVVYPACLVSSEWGLWPTWDLRTPSSHTLQVTRRLSEELSALFGAGFNLDPITGYQWLSKWRVKACHFVGNRASCFIAWLIPSKKLPLAFNIDIEQPQ